MFSQSALTEQNDGEALHLSISIKKKGKTRLLFLPSMQILRKTENQVLKDGKSANRNEHQNRKTPESFLTQKPKTPSKN